MLENPENFLKRKVLLMIILEKMAIFNDKFKAEGVDNYLPPEKKEN